MKTILLSFLLFIFLFTGCYTTKEYTRKEFDTLGRPITEIRVKISDAATETKAENVLVISGKNIKILYIGYIDQTPDPNVVKAFTSGLIGGLGSAIKGGL